MSDIRFTLPSFSISFRFVRYRARVHIVVVVVVVVVGIQMFSLHHMYLSPFAALLSLYFFTRNLDFLPSFLSLERVPIVPLVKIR